MSKLVNFGGRQGGKSLRAELQIKRMLHEGKTVIRVHPGGKAEKLKQFGHLTSIETFNWKRDGLNGKKVSD